MSQFEEINWHFLTDEHMAGLVKPKHIDHYRKTLINVINEGVNNLPSIPVDSDDYLKYVSMRDEAVEIVNSIRRKIIRIRRRKKQLRRLPIIRNIQSVKKPSHYTLVVKSLRNTSKLIDSFGY